MFPEPASYAYLDAATTVMSFAAQILLVQRFIENWYIWIVVDVIGVWLYYVKGVKFIAVLYFIFLILATKGLINWLSDHKAHASDSVIKKEVVS